MRWNAGSLVDAVGARRGPLVALALTAGTLAGVLVAVGSARRAAEAEAEALRQRLVEKRAVVWALQSDLARVADATERVSQMAAIARQQNVEVRRLAQIEEPHDDGYSAEYLSALDEAAAPGSEEGGRALERLAFLEEQLGETTDSLSLMIALSKGVRPVPPASKRTPLPVPAAEPELRLAVARSAPAARARRGEATMSPSLLPVAGEVSSPFGMRLSPWRRGRHLHTGVDIRARTGTPVRTSAAGTVVFAGRDSGGYGTTVVVDHGGDVKTLYGHLSGIYVRTGQRIPRGTVVGAVGSTGRSTGAHLHFEVRIGNVPVDPMLYLKREGGLQQVAAASGQHGSR